MSEGYLRRRRNTRTPSGTNLKNKVFNITSNFNAEVLKEKINDTVQLSSNSELCSHSNQSASESVKRPSHMSDHGNTQTLDNHDQSALRLADKEDFKTPPSTPITRSRGKSLGILTPRMDAKDENSNKMECDAENTTQANANEESDCCEEEYLTVPQQLEKMMENHNEEEEGPQTIDIRVVHTMFKRMQEEFDQKVEKLTADLQTVKAQSQTEQQTTGNHEHTFDEVCQQLTKLTVKTKAISSAVQNSWEYTKEITERLDKLELTAHKKMIVVSGLGLYGRRFEKKKQLENFFSIEMDIQPSIEDFYQIGDSKAVVVILLSNSDKSLIMKNKNRLKGLKNEDKQPIYINEYVTAEKKEKRRWNKQMLNQNENREADLQQKM